MRRELAIWPKSQAPALRRSWARPVRDGVDLAAGDALAGRVTSLGDTPLAVITAGTHKSDSRRMPPPLARAPYGLWMRMQGELAALSSDDVHVVAPRSDHWVQVRRFYRGNEQIDDSPTSSSSRWRGHPRRPRRHASSAVPASVRRLGRSLSQLAGRTLAAR
jgi:hypothetical protein